MTTLQSALTARLSGDNTLVSAPPIGLGFTVYDRWLVKTGLGSTPEAFDDAKSGRLRRSLVVLEAGEADQPGAQGAGTKRYFTIPTVHIFVEAHAGGKQAAQDAYRRIEQLLTGWEVVLVPGKERVGFVTGHRDQPDDTLFPGNLVVVSHWQFTGTRKLSPA